MEKNNELLTNINNIIFFNQEKFNDQDYLDLTNQLKELYDNLNYDDDDSDDEDDDYLEPEEPAERFTIDWWNWAEYKGMSVGRNCILLNTRTKIEYTAFLFETDYINHKAKFVLCQELISEIAVNREVKINFNNKKSLYRFVDFK